MHFNISSLLISKRYQKEPKTQVIFAPIKIQTYCQNFVQIDQELFAVKTQQSDILPFAAMQQIFFACAEIWLHFCHIFCYFVVLPTWKKLTPTWKKLTPTWKKLRPTWKKLNAILRFALPLQYFS